MELLELAQQSVRTGDKLIRGVSDKERKGIMALTPGASRSRRLAKELPPRYRLQRSSSVAKVIKLFWLKFAPLSV